MYYEQLKSTIKEGKLSSLYIFEGQEEYLIDYSINEIKKKLIEPWVEMMNYKSYSDIPAVNEAGDFLETLPVMSERKLLVFKKCGLFSGNIKNKAQWEKIFSEIADFNCVIIWEDLPEKGKKPNSVRKVAESNATVVNFPLQTESALKQWLSNIARKYEKTIDAKLSQYLIASLGRKMTPLKTEFEKIIAYSKGTNITREDVDAVIVKPAQENVFNLIDSIFDGKREVAYGLIYKLRSLKQEPVELISLLSGQLITIYKAKIYLLDGFSRQQTVSKLGGGYGAEKCAAKAEKIKIENIRGLIELCFESDKNIKQGRIDGWTALELIIAEYKFY